MILWYYIIIIHIIGSMLGIIAGIWFYNESKKPFDILRIVTANLICLVWPYMLFIRLQVFCLDHFPVFSGWIYFYKTKIILWINLKRFGITEEDLEEERKRRGLS